MMFMNFTAFLLTLGIVIIFAKIFSSIIEKIKLPGVLGEIFFGMILGNIVLYGYLLGPHISSWLKDWLAIRGPSAFEGVEPMHYIAKLGIIMLLFIAGLDTNVERLKSTGKVATISTIMGVFIPLIMGWLAGLSLGYEMRESLAMGVLLTATSIGVTVRTLMEINMLTSEVGAASLSASVMDDFLGIALIIFVTGTGSLLMLGINLSIFFIVILITWHYIPLILKYTHRVVRTEKGLLGIIIGIMLLFSALAQYSFSAAIEGAYFAGIILSNVPEKRIFSNDIKVIGYGLLIPVFFVYTGAQLDLGVFSNLHAVILGIVIIVIAIVGKVIGRGIGARIGGFDWHKSIQMGIGSIPRMEVALVSLTLAITSGAISKEHAQLFIGATMLFVTITTLITPPLLKWAFRKEIEEMKKKIPSS
ncbi:MAG: cation:proton antiporter [Thermoplasmata archaeon]|nr:cation:proton antiporter [Thermoplasmata archaeon]